MTVALVLSGGGARGDFQLGAIRLLYERGIRPDILVGSSVGAINAAKLAEGEGAANEGLAGLIGIWHSLRSNDDMWSGAPWLSRIDLRLRRALLTQTSPALRSPPPDNGHGFEALLNFLDGVSWLGSEGQAILRALGELRANSSLLTLDPIRQKLLASLNPLRVAQWADPARIVPNGNPFGGPQGPGSFPTKPEGRKLRLASVCLENGRLRFVTEAGAVVERDQRTPVLAAAASSPAVDALEAEIDRLIGEIEVLREQRVGASPGSTTAASVQAKLRAKLADLAKARARLDAERKKLPLAPLTVPLWLAVLASASISVVFPPVIMGGDSYVDGGHRDIVPTQAAADLGASAIYSVLASPPFLDFPTPDDPTPAPKRFSTIPSIALRAMVEIHLDEMEAADIVRPAGYTGALSVIMPTVAIHDLLTVDPGLIRINEGYGYMRAADVLGGIKPESARSQEVDAITMLRAQMWRKECELFGRPIPTAPDETAGATPAMYPALLTDAARLRGLVANRQSAGGALPPEAARWGTTWEAHPWLADTDGPMTALSPGPDRLVVLGAASDGRAMHARWSPSDTWWHGWDGMAYGRTAPGGWVTAVHDGQDTWAFCVDPSGAVVQSYLRATGVWSMWEPLSAQTTGGEFATAPGAPVHAVSCTPGQINVFYANGAGHVLTGTGHGGGWGSFTRIVGGSTRGAGHVTGVSRRDGQLDVFVVAPSGEVTTASWNSGQGWAGWWVIPGMTAVPGTYIGAVSKERDHLDLLAADDEGHVRHASWQGGGWVSWSPVLGGATAPGGFVTAVSRRVDLIDAFTVGTDGRVYTAAWAPPPAPGWMGWWPIGSPGARIDRPVWAVSRSLDKLDVFSTSVDHVVRQAAWEPGGSWKGPWAINEHWNPD